MGNRDFQSCKQISFSPDTRLANWIYKRAGLSFLITPWRFWEFWCFFFISSVLVRETSLYQPSSMVCNSFTQPKILYGKEPKGDCWLAYFWQKSCPQFLQWWRLSVSENRTAQPEQLSPPSSFTQWSAADRPGWSLTDQLNTLPRPSPIRILLWSLQEKKQKCSCNNSGTAMCRHRWQILHVRICNMLNYWHSNQSAN